MAATSGGPIEDVAFDDRGAVGVGIGQAARSSQVMGEPHVGRGQEDRRRVGCELSGGTQDEDARHADVPSFTMRIAFSARG